MKNDTNNDIFGYSWDQIQAAQQGKPFRTYVDLSKPVNNAPTAEDLALLEKHGMDGLKALQYFGTIDRLTRGKYV